MTTTQKKLIVEVVECRNLLPKDGHGTSSPYVTVDFYGQRKRTQTMIRDLNPLWNESLEFDAGKASPIFKDVLELAIFHDKAFGPTRRNNFLGRLRLSASTFVKKGEEALMYLPLEKKDLFSWIQGDIGLKIYFADAEPGPKPEPTPAPEEAQKTEEKVEPEPPQQEDQNSETIEPDQSQPQTTDSIESKELPAKTVLDPPPPPPPIDIQREAAAADHLNMMAASVCMPMQEVKVAGRGPQPIRRLISNQSEIERSSFDLVEKMHYVFVRVVKARSLPVDGAPFVKIAVGSHRVSSKPAGRKAAVFEWDQAFAFSSSDSLSSTLEVSVWDHHDGSFLGGVCFDAAEIPLRDPPESPLALQWYRLEGGGACRGDLMLATWVGTQADDSFAGAWKTDTATPSKVYQSPKLWYLRVSVLEAQDVPEVALQVRAQLGFQAFKTKPAVARNGAPAWNEDLLFVAAEPFDESLTLTLESKGAALGNATIPLSAVERRVDDRTVASRWFGLDGGGGINCGRVHLRVCFDGGYHVMDEAAHVSSDYRPTARQLWNPPVGSVELGIIACRGLVPTKTVGGRGCTDAYCVAKYGPKWVRTRTVSDHSDPRWNEQYTFKVFDPCTVLTVGVFDSCEGLKDSPDLCIGKVRVRISTLSAGRVYRSMYLLLMLTSAGTKKMGELEIAVRFVQASPALEVLHMYSRPLLPVMHHVRPLGAAQQDALRKAAAKAIVTHLSRSDPPLPCEAVLYMLGAEPYEGFSMRRVRANYMRIVRVVAPLIEAIHWVEGTRIWKNPTATVLVHVLLVMLVWFPDLIFPTAAFYVFAVGALNYRLRRRDPPPHFDAELSMADAAADGDELDEEFDAVPSCRAACVVRARYNRLRAVGARVQTALGDLATQGERVQALVTWRDPRATGIFVALCFTAAVVLYFVSSKVVAMAFGFYYFRHPVFRDRMPSPALNFFRRLPSLADRML